MNLEDELALVQGQFEDFVTATPTMRALAKRCRDYYDGNQLTSEERDVLKKRRQPILIDNKVKDKVATLMGLEKQQRTDPKAFPRTPKHEEAAEAATDALRFVADSCDYQRSARKPAVENLIIEGWCYGENYIDKNSRDRKVCMEHIRVDRGYHDIRSLRNDFADKQWCGYFTWMDVDIVRKKWRLGDDSVIERSFEGMGSVPGSDTEHEDKPNAYVEVNGKRRRIQVFTHYHMRDGVWMYSRWCKGGFLEKPKPSVYKDQDGNPDCRIEVQALYRDSDGNCYGEVARYLDLQDAHNKRHSKMLHLLNTKRLVAQIGAFTDVNKARAELHKPDGVLESNVPIDQVRVEDNLDAGTAQFQLLQYTDAMLSQAGPNAAVMGLSGSLSGRAKELDQASGTLSLLPIMDAADAWEIRMYRGAWLCVRQFWTAERWVRVTDDEQKIKYVMLNEPLTVGDVQAQKLKSAPMHEQQKAQMVAQIAQDPMSQQPAIGPNGKPMLKNDVAEMDVDIIISRTQDTVNIQQEQFEMLANLAEKRPQEVPFAVLVEASQLRSEIKRRILDQLSGNDPQSQEIKAVQKRLGELEVALKEATVVKAQAEAQKSMESAQETHVDTAIKVATFTDGSQAEEKASVAVN